MREECEGELRKNCEHKGDEEHKERNSLSTTGAADRSIVLQIVCPSFQSSSAWV